LITALGLAPGLLAPGRLLTHLRTHAHAAARTCPVFGRMHPLCRRQRRKLGRRSRVLYNNIRQLVGNPRHLVPTAFQLTQLVRFARKCFPWPHRASYRPLKITMDSRVVVCTGCLVLCMLVYLNKPIGDRSEHFRTQLLRLSGADPQGPIFHREVGRREVDGGLTGRMHPPAPHCSRPHTTRETRCPPRWKADLPTE
jgi:hypothetical protein